MSHSAATLLRRQRLQHAHLPARIAGGHDHQIILCKLIGVDDLIAVEHLYFETSGVAKLHGGTILRVEDGLDIVAMIDIAGVQPRLLLRGDALL